MRDKDIEELARKWLPSQQTIIRVLVGCVVVCVLAAGYAVSAMLKAQQRAQTAEQQVEQLKMELTKVFNSTDRTLVAPELQKKHETAEPVRREAAPDPQSRDL